MARSGPCGSDRPDTSLTSSGTAPAHGAMQYRSQSGATDPAKTGTWLAARYAGNHEQRAVRGSPAGVQALGKSHMAKATLTISSKNYSSWSLRGWLLTKFSGLDFDE